uniref:Uncharacterized protein n=1 Tax=Setaria viridis TaxID=4556 RepID=A0A4V6Y8N4_SETVI|nr:hypothetical protein SEVIR_3G171550v2 [Setaria viridis]
MTSPYPLLSLRSAFPPLFLLSVTLTLSRRSCRPAPPPPRAPHSSWL